MKLITAVIKPFKVDEVRQAVADIGIQGLTVTEVHGYGRQHGHTEVYRGAEYSVEFLPKAKIELAVDDSIAEQVMEAVCNVARTGKTGDGKVWIFELEEALRVRTGETGPDAFRSGVYEFMNAFDPTDFIAEDHRGLVRNPAGQKLLTI